MFRVQNLTYHGPTTPAQKAAVTIGNFDGCHLGHQALIEAVKGLAAEHAIDSVAVSFSPHPASFLNPHAEALARLFTEAQKSRAFEEQGLSRQVRQVFDAGFSQLSHEDFFRDYLQGTLGARAIVIGENFRFGRDRKGNPLYLKEKAEPLGIAVRAVKALEFADLAISSTRIREALKERGDVEAASEMLGRPYMLEGTIASGDRLGREIGTPTANLEGIEQLIPRYGIYAGYVALLEQEGAFPRVMSLPVGRIPAVFSIGVRPTLKGKAPPLRVEAHLLTGSYGPNELYGFKAGFYLTHRLRDEATFANLEDLKHAIAQDIALARRLLNLA